MDSDLVALPRLLGLLAVRLQRHLHLGVNVNLKVSRFLHLQPVLPAANCLGVDRHGAAHGRHHENPHDTDHKTITGVENVGLCKCAQFLGRWSTAAGGAWLCARRAGGGGAWRLERWAEWELVEAFQLLEYHLGRGGWVDLISTKLSMSPPVHSNPRHWKIKHIS